MTKMKPLNIKISISLPQIAPSFLKKAEKLIDKDVAVEEKNKIDPQEQMLRPDSNRKYLEHEVKKGEDWFDIAKQYDIDGTELEDFNSQFTSVPLHEGMKVKIPRHFIKK